LVSLYSTIHLSNWSIIRIIKSITVRLNDKPFSRLIMWMKPRVPIYEDEYPFGWQIFCVIPVVIWHPSLRNAQKKIVLCLASHFTATNIIYYRSFSLTATATSPNKCSTLQIHWEHFETRRVLPYLERKTEDFNLFTVLTSNDVVTKMCSTKLYNYCISVMKGIATFVINLVFYGVTLVWFPEDGPLQSETCRNNQCRIVIQTLREKGWAFFGLVSWKNDR